MLGAGWLQWDGLIGLGFLTLSPLLLLKERRIMNELIPVDTLQHIIDDI